MTIEASKENDRLNLPIYLFYIVSNMNPEIGFEKGISNFQERKYHNMRQPHFKKDDVMLNSEGCCQLSEFMMILSYY